MKPKRKLNWVNVGIALLVIVGFNVLLMILNR